MAVALPLQLVLGLLLALHFQQDRPLKKLFVALLVLPAVISPMVAGSMWRLMFDHKFGPVNQIISWFTEKPVVLLWIVKAPLPFWAIIIAEVWQWTPFMFVILLAALANLDRDQLDAASLDGANRFQSFRHIVLPAILPVVVIALLIRGLDLFRIFDAVWQLTRGGPGNRTETLSVFMYIKGFQGFETSYIAATGRRAGAAVLGRGHDGTAPGAARSMRAWRTAGWYARLARWRRWSSCSRSTGCSRCR